MLDPGSAAWTLGLLLACAPWFGEDDCPFLREEFSDHGWPIEFVAINCGNPGITVDGFPDYTFEVAVGDLNGDGCLDVVGAGRYSDTLYVLLNEGDGHFDALGKWALGDRPSHVALGDLNGDDAPDIVVTNRDEDTLSVLLNKGDGQLFEQVVYPTIRSPQRAAIADFDGNGQADVVVTTGAREFVIHTNHGEGMLERGVTRRGVLGSPVGRDRSQP